MQMGEVLTLVASERQSIGSSRQFSPMITTEANIQGVTLKNQTHGPAYVRFGSVQGTGSDERFEATAICADVEAEESLSIIPSTVLQIYRTTGYESQ